MSCDSLQDWGCNELDVAHIKFQALIYKKIQFLKIIGYIYCYKERWIPLNFDLSIWWMMVMAIIIFALMVMAIVYKVMVVMSGPNYLLDYS